MIPLLVEACPSFSEKWERHKIEYGDEEDFLPYVALGRLSEHLIQLFDRGASSELESVFAVIERLHTEGERYVTEAVTIGLLEGLQNRLGNAGRDPEIVRDYLLPVSAGWWNQLNLFWEGKIKYVGESLNAKD